MLIRHSWIVASLAFAGCGGNASVGDDGSPDAPAAFVTAPHAAVPQLVDQGGGVLVAPKVRPIFFANDAAIQAQVEQFAAQLAGSSYWTATTHEYGVGALTVLPTIVATGAPPATDQALLTWLASNLDGTHPEWGTPDPSVIYSVFLPEGAVLQTQSGPSCEAFGAFHDEATGAHGEPIVYALMPRCIYDAATPAIEDLTISFSHELAEAATDPYVSSTPGAFGSVDADHAVWAFVPGAENGDFCEYAPEANQRLVGSFMVQRTWSNAAALAGHDPCVPALETPYAAAAPSLVDSVGMTDGPNGPMTTLGVKVPISTSKTIDVAVFSDAPTDDVTVEAIDVASDFGGAAPELTFAWDKQTGHNGDVLHLTITRRHPGDFGGSEFVINTSAGGKLNAMWWGYAAN